MIRVEPLIDTDTDGALSNLFGYSYAFIRSNSRGVTKSTFYTFHRRVVASSLPRLDVDGRRVSQSVHQPAVEIAVQ